MQEDIISAVLDGQHALALLPTGGGKSICFQVPALCLDGICIVVSPLIALMRDQVFQLKKRGIKSVAIFSGMSPREIDIALDNCIYGDIRFLYVSPERLKTELFLERAKQMDISLLAIDEAHCISQWGYDFRPPYLEIQHFIEQLSIERVMALTASATKEVKDDIISKLGLHDPKVFKKSFARENLSYSAFRMEDKDGKMMEILTKVPGSSVVYVRNRKKTRGIAHYLKANGISADYYHAGLTGEERSTKQDLWIRGRIRVMVATNAFGMGIDKADVRTVIHYDLPDSLEAYYQEAGRAGRDEKKAYAVALFQDSDIDELQSRAEQMSVGVEFIRRVYQALANHYRLAVGSKPMASFPFDYLQFTSSFNLPAVETYYALNKLQDEGFIQVSDVYMPTSRVLFLLSKEEVYKFQVANSNLDPLVKAVLRMYGGEAFTSYVPLKETDLAKLTNLTVNKVITQLEYLHLAEVLEYQRAADKPQMIFLTPRVEANNLPLDKKRIEWRKEVTLGKAKSVIDYMTNTAICRTRFIQNYFDEDARDDCGICDVCRKKDRNHGDLPMSEVLGLIEKEPLDMDGIAERLKGHDPQVVIEAIRKLMDRKDIQVSDSGMYSLNTH